MESLSILPFDSFYKEENLQSFENKSSFVLNLLNNNKNVGSKQLHKILFLIFAEGRIMMPFKFIKHQFGPFSEELNQVLEELQSKKLVKKEETTEMYVPHKRSLTEEGQKFLKLQKPETTPTLAIIENVISNHKNDNGEIDGANSLERYCYNTYYLEKKDMSNEEWDAKVNNKITDAIDLLNKRAIAIKNLDGLEEEKVDVILMLFDYVNNLLRKLLSSKEMDQVIKGVLIKNIEEYINKWGEILRLSENPQSIKDLEKLILESRIIFKFLNEISLQYRVFNSVFNMQVIEVE